MTSEQILLSIEKEMAYLKGFLKGQGFNQSLLALQFAKRCHDGQTRRSGEPYIMHPVRVCATLAALGVHDDKTLAVALLHDVVEDCKVSIPDLLKTGFDADVAYGVDYLSKKADQTTEEYYAAIGLSKLPHVILPKLCDRMHNVSTMAGAFSAEKIQSYVDETETHVYKVITRAKSFIPQYSEQLFVMKYSIESLIKAYKLFLDSLNGTDSDD